MIGRARALAALAALALAACTYDLHLGARAPACDPAAGDLCPCADTSECPPNFYCIGGNTGASCRPPAGCTIAPGGDLDCPAAGCNPATEPGCNPADPCSANVCGVNTDACCAADSRCYPASCIGCCMQ